MRLATALNAPRILRIGGRPYFAGRLTLLGHAILLAHVADRVEGDTISAAEADQALCEPQGLALQVYACLYRHNPGLTLEAAETLSASMESDERLALYGYLYARDRTEGEAGAEQPQEPQPISLGEALVESLEGFSRFRGIDYLRLQHHTLEQLEAMASEGGRKQPGKPADNGHVAAVEKWAQWQRQRKANGEPYALDFEEQLAAAREGRPYEPKRPENAPSPDELAAIERLEAARRDIEADSGPIAIQEDYGLDQGKDH